MAARSVGGKQVLVHEDIALIDGRAVGGIEQRQKRDPAIQQRQVLHLFMAKTVSQLRHVSAHFPCSSGDNDFSLDLRNVQLQGHVNVSAANQGEFAVQIGKLVLMDGETI